TNAVHEYDPATEIWSEAAPLDVPRGALAAAVLDGKIHAVGGVGGERKNSAAHEVYDPTTKKWSKAAPLPTPRDHHAAVSLDRRRAEAGRRGLKRGRDFCAVSGESHPFSASS